MYFSIEAILYFNPLSACFLRSSLHRVSRFSCRERRRSGERHASNFSGRVRSRCVSSTRTYIPGVWKLRYRRKIEVLGVKGEWREREREGGWILNRPSTYRGMKTANGEGSKLKKKKGKSSRQTIYLFFFRRDRVEFLLSA